MAQLTCKNLSLGYDKKVIVNNLNFTVSKGDYLCIVGNNGTGKSTLIKTILQLQPPLGGTIELGDSLKWEEIGYLPQQTETQKDFPASVWEVVLSGCLSRTGFRPFYNQSEKLLAKKAMAQLGIDKLEKSCYRDLSGGQQQRVLLARGLCATQKMLLLDEPVSGLDPEAMAEMYSIIKQLNRDGITIIMISHDVAQAVEYASHVLHLGFPSFFGPKQEYLNSIGKGAN